MSVIPCLSWVRSLWGQVHGLFGSVMTVYSDLPDEIIADILGRLPAECVFLCGDSHTPLGALTRTPSFADMHLNRVTPVTAFQYFFLSDKMSKYGREIRIHFTHEVVADKIVSKSIDIDLTLACPKKGSAPLLFGSYNGFLLFKNLEYDSVLVLWNPITQEQVTLIAPHDGYRVRGIFFHSTDKEYRVIFISLKSGCFEFVIFSLKTKSSRIITGFTHPPSGIIAPTVLNGVLHWMICDESYKEAHGFYPCCENSIVSFNTNSEELRTMRHPGPPCGARKEHNMMKLMEKDGQLLFFDDSLCGRIVVWTLIDYEKEVWVKKHVITLKPLNLFCRARRCNCNHMIVEVWYIFGEELLLRVGCKDLLLYDPELCTMRRVGEKSKKTDLESVLFSLKNIHLPVTAVLHVNSLVSLHTDKIVYLFKDDELT
ncbi:hypothetical protein AQUCO_00100217v1 [Aquilegia coerulea]|uniref:F-box associated beta-propeller type 3 domain-containing protein n=1 Tax=Aquilegia coerulea TaxID=218851 RepID=A0A2G5F9H9_AQUCA|nr:hypothetical protein AQUCO_00100217v1 [Aquilegia coerulea]